MIIIKSEKEINCIEKASNLLAKTFEYIEGFITSDITTLELDRKIEEYIKEIGGRPAFKGYKGFPASACISINEVVIHGIPDERKLKSGDIVGIDIGIEHSGCFSDAAFTFGVGEVSKEKESLMKTTKKALFNAIEVARVGNRVGDISNIIQKTSNRAGYSVVRDYVGHGVGIKLHEEPPIPNFGKKGVGPRLKKGMTIAIEPMFNLGTFRVDVLKDNWTVVTKDRKPSAHYEHTILITDNNAKILTDSSLYES
jgi:methionyl aminopeptidase